MAKLKKKNKKKRITVKYVDIGEGTLAHNELELDVLICLLGFIFFQKPKD